MAGPVYCAAASPVRTKMPVPMMAPMPSVTRLIGPSTRLSECSPVLAASTFSCSIDFVAKIDIVRSLERGRGAGDYTLLNPGEPLDVRAHTALRVARAEEIANHGDRRRPGVDGLDGR